MGGKIIPEYRDPQFSQGQASEHKLSVLIGGDGLCYEVSGPNGDSLAWKDYASSPAAFETDIYTILGSDPLLGEQRYGTTLVSFFDGPAAIAPARLFDPGRAAAYWEALSPLRSGQKALCDPIPALDAYLVYPASEKRSESILSKWPAARIFHGATAWLTGVSRYALSENANAIYAHASGGMLLVAAFDGKALRFLNFFSYQTAHDFLYYVLLALDQAQFPLEQTSLYLSGKMTVEAEIFLLLQRYFISLYFLAPDSIGPYPVGLPEDRRHWYFDLLCTRLM